MLLEGGFADSIVCQTANNGLRNGVERLPFVRAVLFVHGAEHFRFGVVYGFIQRKSVGRSVFLPDVFIRRRSFIPFAVFLENDGCLAVRSDGGSVIFFYGSLLF